MKSTLSRTLSALVVAAALVVATGAVGAAAALNAKPLRAELTPDSATVQVVAKPLRAE